MFELLLDNKFAMIGENVCPQRVSISMGTNCASLFAYLFLYSLQADFMHRLLNKNEKKLDQFIDFTFRDIDDVL